MKAAIGVLHTAAVKVLNVWLTAVRGTLSQQHFLSHLTSFCKQAEELCTLSPASPPLQRSAAQNAKALRPGFLSDAVGYPVWHTASHTFSLSSFFSRPAVCWRWFSVDFFTGASTRAGGTTTRRGLTAFRMLSVPDMKEWISAKPAPVSGVPPSSAVSDGSPPTSSSEESEAFRTKLMVGVATTAIGVLCGMTLYRAQQEAVPQILFPEGVGEDAGTSPGCPTKRIVFVNLSAANQRLAAEAMKSWFPDEDRSAPIKCSYEHVTFFDETNDETVNNLRDAVRYEALTAFAELRSRSSDVACVAVYRSAVALNDEAVELMDRNARTLQRAHGKAFHERHCLAFTVDGKGAEVLVHDVVGVIDATLWSCQRDDAEKLSIAEVLRRCCVATRDTLEQHSLRHGGLGLFNFESPTDASHVQAAASTAHSPTLPLYRDDTAAFAAAAGGEAAADATASSPALHNAERFLWRSPLTLFADFAAVVRLGRRQYGGVRQLAARQPEPTDAPGARILRTVMRKLRDVFSQRGAPQCVEDAPVVVRPPLSARFYAAFFVEGTMDRETEALLSCQVRSLVVHYVGGQVFWDGAPNIDTHLASFLFTVRESGKTCVVVDLTAVEGLCSVLQAHLVAAKVATVLSAVGAPLVSWTLYASNVSEAFRSEFGNAALQRRAMKTLISTTEVNGSQKRTCFTDLAHRGWGIAGTSSSEAHPDGTYETMCVVAEYCPRKLQT